MTISDFACVERICVIVNFGQGSKVLKSARNHGISGGTILLGMGTASGRLVDFLGLTEVRKELVFMVAERETARAAMKKLDEDFLFEKPNHGIAFSTSVMAIAGTRNCRVADEEERKEAEEIMFQAITVIVDRGRAELVIESAAKAGAKGGTVLHARGSGVHETRKLFGIDIEPEKEMVLILVEKEKADRVIEQVRKDLEIDLPGKGILFVQDVSKAYGLVR